MNIYQQKAEEIANEMYKLVESRKHPDELHCGCFAFGVVKFKEAVAQALEQAAAEASERKANRLEVIDHTKDGKGRAYVKWVEQPFKITLDAQDGGATLKIFLDELYMKLDDKTKEILA